MARAHRGHGLTPRVGEIAGLGTSLSWSLCAQFFGAAGLRVGSVAVNHLRLIAAIVILVAWHALATGTVLPGGISPRSLLLLVASGIFGLIVADAAYFHALVLVGPATATIMVTATPAVATLEAWLFLDETLPPRILLAILVTVTGILVAVRARTRRDPAASVAKHAFGGPLALGLIFAGIGAVGQATGQVLARPALQAGVDALPATLVRVATATALMWGVVAARTLLARRPPGWLRPALNDRRALVLTFGGVVTGPTLGIWLSQLATKHAPVGIASTLMSLVPIFVVLEDWVIGRRKPSPLELVGATIAVGGVALLVWG